MKENDDYQTRFHEWIERKTRFARNAAERKAWILMETERLKCEILSLEKELERMDFEKG